MSIGSLKAQKKNFRFGMNLSNNYSSFSDYNITPAITYSSQRHFFSLGPKVFEPNYYFIKKYGFDTYYKFYTDTSSNYFDLYFFSFAEIMVDKQDYAFRTFEYYNGQFYEAHSDYYSEKKWFFNMTIGYGLDVNLSDNFYINSNFGLGLYHDETMYIPIANVDPGYEKITKYSISNNLSFSYILNIGLGYKFERKNDKK